MFKIELGSEVKSDITGFQGITTARSEHLNGCNRYWIQPKVDKEGKIREGNWVDEQELELVNPPVINRAPDTTKHKPGGFPSQIK